MILKSGKDLSQFYAKGPEMPEGFLREDNTHNSIKVLKHIIKYNKIYS